MPCTICRGQALRSVGVKNSYPFSRCRACEHLFGTRMPSDAELAEFYSRYSYDVHDLSRVPDFISSRLSEIVVGFEGFRRTNRLLDVGFGAGAMLRAADGNRWEPHGIETSRLAVEKAKKNGFLLALEGDFLRAPYPQGYFDVIVATELLEHLPDPLPFIRKAWDLLAPHGAFYLTTPNGDGISCRLLGVDWSVVDPPEHLNLFSRRSLTLALKSQGFRTVRIDSEGVNPYELAHRWKTRSGRALPATAEPVNHGQSTFDLNSRLTTSASGKALKSMANFLLRLSRLGDGLKATARK